MKVFVILLLCSILFLNTSYKPARDLRPQNDFRLFLAKFKPLQLPLTIDPFEINLKSCIKLTKADNRFVKSQTPDELYAYGILPDTVNSYKLIWLEPSEIQMPYLATFTKNGKFIKKQFLGVGQCGSDCCYECKEFIRINKDLTILSADSIKSCKCDVNGPIANTTEKYVLLKTGAISKDGIITMTEFSKKAIAKK